MTFWFSALTFRRFSRLYSIPWFSIFILFRNMIHYDDVWKNIHFSYINQGRSYLFLKLSNQSGNDQLYLRFRKSRFRRIFRNLRNCWFKRWTITFVTCTTSSFCLNSVILASFFSLVTHNRAQKNIGHVSFCIKGLCKFHF